MSKRKKKYSEMNTAELAKATKAYDEDFAVLKARPLTSREEKHHAAARLFRRGRGGYNCP